CIAAAFVSWVAESTLTGPGAGGFMLVHRARDRSTRVLDHFVTVPGLGLDRREVAEMESVDVAFTPESSQAFRIGTASCAVPGALERLAEHGADDLYRGDLARALAAHLREGGGAITERDLAEYRVIRRRPVRARFLGHEFESNPPPSAGGVLIGLGVRLLDRLGPAGPPGSAAAIAQLVEIMRQQDGARNEAFARDLYRGGLASRLLDPRAV